MDFYFCILGVLLIAFIVVIGYCFVAREERKEWKYKREYDIYSIKYQIITSIIKDTVENDLNCDEAINKLYYIVEHEIL